MVIFESERTFEVVTWRAGLPGLVLRSRVGEQDTSRIEVYFRLADHVCLPAWMDGLRIEDTTWRAKRRVVRLLGVAISKHQSLYMIFTQGAPKGWVIGGIVGGRQDRHDFNAPTMFPHVNEQGSEDGVEDLFWHGVQ